MKDSTRQLIESFRYRRLAYLPKDNRSWQWSDNMTLRQQTALWEWIDIKSFGSSFVRDSHMAALDFRKHMRSLNPTTLA